MHHILSMQMNSLKWSQQSSGADMKSKPLVFPGAGFTLLSQLGGQHFMKKFPQPLVSIAGILEHFFALDNPKYDDNNCNDKQHVDEASGIKCKESNKPSNYKDDRNDIK